MKKLFAYNKVIDVVKWDANVLDTIDAVSTILTTLPEDKLVEILSALGCVRDTKFDRSMTDKTKIGSIIRESILKL